MSDQNQIKDWPHAPIHRLGSHGVFMVTGATLYKEHLFNGEERLTMLEHSLLSLSKQYGWQLEAWSVFSNHYHFVGRGVEDSQNLGVFLNHLHSDTARNLNILDQIKGRQVWFNFWDTKLTYKRSYLARLNYVHQNEAQLGFGCKSVSLVFRCLVRAHGFTCNGEDYL
jgi:putative transposase